MGYDTVLAFAGIGNAQALEMQLVLKKFKLFSDVLNVGDFTKNPSIEDVDESESITICRTLLQQHLIP